MIENLYFSLSIHHYLVIFTNAIILYKIKILGFEHIQWVLPDFGFWYQHNIYHVSQVNRGVCLFYLYYMLVKLATIIALLQKYALILSKNT
jgi:hypothetical protein